MRFLLFVKIVFVLPYVVAADHGQITSVNLHDVCKDVFVCVNLDAYTNSRAIVKKKSCTNYKFTYMIKTVMRWKVFNILA